MKVLYIYLCLILGCYGFSQTIINVGIGQQFETIEAAKTHVRTINQNMNADIVIKIHPGTYILEQTIEFTHLDSGYNNHRIIYEAADSNNKPIISGGYKVENWELHDTIKNIWKANIGNRYSRQLYVNGVRAIRARSEDSFNLFQTKTGYFSTCTNFNNWEKIKDMEIVSYISYQNHRIPIESVCGNQININQEFWESIHQWGASHHVLYSSPVRWIENHYNFIDEDFEWYINRDMNSLYIKLPSSINSVQQVNQQNIILPIVEKLYAFNGEKEHKINMITLKDLEFNYNTWTKPSKLTEDGDSNYGFTTYKGADQTYPEMIIGALSLIYCDNFKFVNNIFKHLGSTGVSFFKGCNNNLICSNLFQDISGSGIYLGNHVDWPNPCLHPNLNPTYYDSICLPNNYHLTHAVETLNENIIQNNILTNIANEYFSCSGITVTYARDTKILNNTVSSFPYSGITLGWGLNRFIDHGNNNEIKNNRIDCYGQFMADGGGIYMQSNLGNGNNRCLVSGNYILNQRNYVGAIYLDQATSNVNLENNIIDVFDEIIRPDYYQCALNFCRAISVPPENSIIDISSYNIAIINNFYNSKYNFQDNWLFSFPIENIQFQNNIPFNNFSGYIGSNHQQNVESIINNSGAEPSITCN